MVNLLGHVDAIHGSDPLAQLGGLALDFVARMVPAPLGMFLVSGDEDNYALITVKSDPILGVGQDEIGRRYLEGTKGDDPVLDLVRGHTRTVLFGTSQLRVVDSFEDGPLEVGFIDEFELGPVLILAMWEASSAQHCVLLLARSSGETEFSEREKGFLRHAAPLLAQSYHCAIGMGGMAAPLPGTLAAELTPRELEIAELAARGARNAEIANRLNIAPGTVKCHMHNVYGKLGITSRVHLALALGVPH